MRTYLKEPSEKLSLGSFISIFAKGKNTITVYYLLPLHCQQLQHSLGLLHCLCQHRLSCL